MKKVALGLTITALSTLLLSQTAFAEPHPGKVLHEENNCLRCHAEKPYNPSKTDSYSKLIKSVRFCNENLGIGLFDDEIDELTDYLNTTYYQHDK